MMIFFLAKVGKILDILGMGGDFCKFFGVRVENFEDLWKKRYLCGLKI